MATTTLVGLIQRFGDQTVERHKVTISRTENTAIDITANRIARIEVIDGPCIGVVTAASSKVARITSYPMFAEFVVDDINVTGVDDLVESGTYTGTEPAYYKVRISSAAASPDEFKWSKNGGTESIAVGITGAAQNLSDGVQITFGTIDGHTLDDYWVVTAHPATTTFYVELSGYGG